MKELIQLMEKLRINLDKLRRTMLKETPTRTIFISPILEALGWDVCDPDEVEEEYPTVDGKSVDYALKINRKPVLLVEAKPLNDSLDDVKAITQVVGYATNAGIDWCVLTNGIRWRIYKSVEKCPAPEKLLYEVSFDPQDSGEMPLKQVAEELWRLSREEMAKGTLDALGEQMFTDSKVRKALEKVMIEPPRAFIKVIRTAAGDEKLKPQKIKESLARICGTLKAPMESSTKLPPPIMPKVSSTRYSEIGVTGWETKLSRGKSKEYDEAHHIKGKPREIIEIYTEIKKFCLVLDPDAVIAKPMKLVIGFYINKRVFCSILLRKSLIRIWLKLKYKQLSSPPEFARDVSKIGHWGTGDLELGVTDVGQLPRVKDLIRQSYEAMLR